jgi:hypothetical protein
VSRDIMIVSRVIVSWLFEQADPDEPVDGVEAHTVAPGRVRGTGAGCPRI